MVIAGRNECRNPERGERFWLEAGKLLMVLCMAVLFFLLGQQMVRHHFFTGGSQNYRLGGGWQ